MVNQLRAHYYLINEAGGISHLAPDYEKLIAVGTDGIVAEVRTLEKDAEPGTDRWNFYEGVKIIAEGLAQFGERYAELASRMAFAEQRPRQEKRAVSNRAHLPPGPAERRTEASARRCSRSSSPRSPSTWKAWTTPCARAGWTSTCIPITGTTWSGHGSPGAGQRTAVGVLHQDVRDHPGVLPAPDQFPRRHVQRPGGDRGRRGCPDGKDATNELSYIFLEIMDELRMRQPNYHARVHAKSPRRYLDMIYEVLAAGSNSPALYNDDVIVPALREARLFTRGRAGLYRRRVRGAGQPGKELLLDRRGADERGPLPGAGA